MIEIDLTDNIDCLPAGLNESRTCAMNNCMTGVFNSIDPDIPHNAGTFRRVQVKLRENCVVGIPTLPALVLGGDDERRRAARRHDPALDRRRLARLRPGRGRLRHRARLRRRLGHRLPQGRRRRTSTRSSSARRAARPGRSIDGWVTYGNAVTNGLMFRDSVEIDELKYPIRVREIRIRQDSEGAGRRRGAPGAIVAVRAEARHDDGRLRDRRPLPSAARHAGRRRRRARRSPTSCSRTAARSRCGRSPRRASQPGELLGHRL